MDPYLGEIRTFPWSFAPRGWAFCNGALLPIAQNQAMFALLGTRYGGNGTTTFALPNLQGRAPIGAGQLSGGQNYTQGQSAGTETVTLALNELPQHIHLINAQSASGNVPLPAGNLPATAAPASTGGPTIALYSAPSTPVPLAGTSLSNTGGGQSHANMQPFLVLNFCIATQGIFPPRS